MSVTLLLDEYSIPEQGDVELNLNRSFRINTTAQEAKKKVNHWLFTQVSCMMMADTPTLVVGSTITWRVPAIFCATHIGPVGEVSAIDVDVYTDEMSHTGTQKESLLRKAKVLAQQIPSYTVQDLSPEYVVPNVQTAPLPLEGESG